MKACRHPFLLWWLLLSLFGLGLVALRAPLLWPSPIKLELRDLDLQPGSSYPVLVIGSPGKADFLFLRCRTDGLYQLGYDSWGHGGPLSDPFELEQDNSLELEIRLPSHGTGSVPDKHLQVRGAARLLLDAEVHSQPGTIDTIHLGVNPAGGSSCGPSLPGKVLLEGLAVSGATKPDLTLPNRLVSFIKYQTGRVLAVLLISALAVLAFSARGRAWFRSVPGNTREKGPSLKIFLLCLTLCSVPCYCVLTQNSLSLFDREDFGAFYDYQARSLLEGRLDVPEDAIGGEAFIHQGKTYGYFGPTPALLRLPLALFDVGEGRLSRPLMFAAYLLSLTAGFLLLREAFRLARPGATQDPPVWAQALLTLNLGLGSTLFFLAGRAYVYHEAILWGVCFALWSCLFSLRWLRESQGNAWIPALILGTLSVNARGPVGLFALSLLGVTALLHLYQQFRSTKRLVRHTLAIALFAVVGVLSFNAISYLKFGTIEGCPLRLNRAYTPARLAKIGDRQFHAVNIPYAFDLYVIGGHYRLQEGAPWFLLGNPAKLKKQVKAKMDMVEPTGAFQETMPALWMLAVAGSVLACLLVPSLRPPLLVCLLASVPMSLALMAAIAVSHRYSADFLPILLLPACFGLAAITLASGPAARLLRGCVWALTPPAILISLLITLHFQRAEIWGVPESLRAQYKKSCQKIDHVLGIDQTEADHKASPPVSHP